MLTSHIKHDTRKNVITHKGNVSNVPNMIFTSLNIYIYIYINKRQVYYPNELNVTVVVVIVW
jgi:hypothetical protein